MEQIVEDTVSDEEIAKLARLHEESKKDGSEAQILAKFKYAYALLKSRHTQDVSYGINLLENLYYEGEQSAKRDYLYYIAIGQTRLKKYNLALDCVKHFLQFEPENRQAKQLKKYIEEKLTKDGLIGIAVTSGAALALGGLIGLGLSLYKK